MFGKLAKFISLKEAAKKSGYASDYIGYLIRIGEIRGKKAFGRPAWFVNIKDLLAYKEKKYKKRKNLIYDIFPPIREKTSYWIKAFRLFLKTSKYAFVLIFFIVVICGDLIAWAILSEDSEVLIMKTYPTLCQGGWENLQNAQGEPNLVKGKEFQEFNEENSAILRNSISQIFCKGFEGEIPDETKIKKVSLKFSWAFKKEISEFLISTPAPSEENLLPEEIPIISNPENGEESLPPTSFWQKIISFVFAQEEIIENSEINIEEENLIEENLTEENLTESEEILINEEIKPELEIEELVSEEPIIDEELIFQEEELSFEEEKIIEDITSDAFLEIFYTLNGEDWQSLGKVNNNNWQNLSLEIPISDWEDLGKIQIKIQSLMVFDDQPTIYLDGLWLEIEYKKLSGDEELSSEEIAKLPRIEIEKEKLFKISKKDFQANEEPEFEINTVSLVEEYLKIESTATEEIEGPSVVEEDVLEEEVVFGEEEVLLEVPIETKEGIDSSALQFQEEEAGIQRESEDVEITPKEIPLLESQEQPQNTFEEENPPTSFFKKLKSFFNIQNVIAKNKKPKIKILRTIILGPDGAEITDINDVKKIEKETSIQITKPNNSFEPGKYEIQIEVLIKGKIFVSQKEFTWGVLAINTNKSIYLPNETAYLQMAVLNDVGHTICNANLRLEITNPKSETEIITTEQGTIHYSDTCGADNVTDNPDYFAYYRTGETGKYQMKLTNLDNGYEITDSFEVKESVPFEVERLGATRINPFKASYRMTIKIKANDDFRGNIIEKVPSSFDINDQFSIFPPEADPPWAENFQIISNDQNFKFLVWKAKLNTGETYEISYTYQAPEISPQLYLLGPLEFSADQNWLLKLLGPDEKTIFKEARQWQIAADLVTSNGDGILFYAAAANTTPQWRTYSNSANDFSANSGTVVGAQPVINQIKTSPTKQEAIAAYQDTSGNLRVLCYNGTTWTQDWTVVVAGAGTPTTRRFDIAYETNTGDVTVAYSRNTAAANALAYRYKLGSAGCGSANWAAAQNFPTTTTVTSATIMWVKAVRDGRSAQNLQAWVWLDNAATQADLGGAIWSGTAFTNFKQIETSMEHITAVGDTDNFDVQYESLSGDVMVVWGNSAGGSGANGYRYMTCTGGTSACTWSALTTLPGPADGAMMIDLSADPLSNKMAMAGICTASDDMSAGYWNGTGPWAGVANLDISTETTAQLPGMKLMTTGWLTNGANTKWYISYDDSTGTGISWYLQAAGTPPSASTKQSDYSTTPGINDLRGRYDTDMNPFNNAELIQTLSDVNNQIIAFKLTMDAAGTVTWSDMTTAVSLGTKPSHPQQGFSFTYWRFIPTYTISGTVYDADESSGLTSQPAMKLAVGASTSYDTTANVLGGFSFTIVAPPADGTVMTIWLDTGAGTDKANLVFKYGSSCTGYPTSCSGLSLYQNRVNIDSKDGTSITNANLAACDNDSGGPVCGDTDIGFTSESNVLTLTFSTNMLRITSGVTFAPGGAVNCQKLRVAGTYTGASETLTLSGSGTGKTCGLAAQMPLCVDGVYTTSSNTTKFTGTSASYIALNSNFFNLEMSPATAPTYTLGTGLAQTLTVGGTLAIGDATNALIVTAATNVPNISVTGTATISANAIFTIGSGTQNFSSTLTTNGTLNGSGDLGISGSANGTGTINLSGGTFKQRTSAAQTFGTTSDSNPWTFYNLTFEATLNNPITFNAGTGDINIAGVLTVGGSSGATVTVNFGSRNIVLSGDGTPFAVTAFGIFDEDNSTFNFISPGLIVIITAETYNNLTLGPTLVTDISYGGAGAININSNLDINPSGSANSLSFLLGGTTIVTGSTTVRSTGGSATSILGTTASDYDLTSGIIDIQSSGTLDANGSTITLNGTGDVFIVSGSFVKGTSTVGYAGSNSQNISATNYYNLTSSSTGARVLASSGTIGIAAVFTPGANSYTVTGSTIDFNGISPQTINADFIYNNLQARPTVNDITDTFSAGTVTVNGDFTAGNGTNTGIVVTAATNSTILNISSTSTISANTTFTAHASNSFTVGGSWSNSGKFTANDGTLTLNGSGLQTLTGTMIGASSFYNFIITNTYGSFTNCATAFSPGIDFEAAAKVTNNYIINVAARVEYESGVLYEFYNIDWNGGGADMVFRNSTLGSGTWLLKVTGSQGAGVTDVNVARSDAFGGGGGQEIDADDGTNVDCSNNLNWNFTQLSISFDISSNSLSLGNLNPFSVFSNNNTTTVSTNASSGYVLYVSEDGNLRKGLDDINDVLDGEVTLGEEEYGLNTGYGDFITDSAITSLVKIAREYGLPVTDQETTYNYKAAVSTSTATGYYSHIITIVVTGKF